MYSAAAEFISERNHEHPKVWSCPQRDTAPVAWPESHLTKADLSKSERDEGVT